jgi:hypothetical protein
MPFFVNEPTIGGAMLAQIILTPTESKKLIAKSLAKMDIVKKAAQDGMVVVHPSSSTYFLVEELTGSRPETNYWVCGVVAPRGNCIEMGILIGDYLPKHKSTDPGDFRTWWMIKNGKLTLGAKVTDLLKQVKPTDVFIKGVNALDPQGNVGILIGDPLDGGAMGRIISFWRNKPFHLLFPVGLEKLIPTSISEAAKEAKLINYDYAMGLATGLLPCPNGENINVVTEIEAIKILSGATAVPIAAGGLGGAEGSITLILKGNEEQVKKAIELVEQSKGAKLPELRLGISCEECRSAHCQFPVSKKPWVKVSA